MDIVSNLGFSFESVVQKYADRTVLQNPLTGERKTYLELANLADIIAKHLVMRGFKRGDVGVIFHDKSAEAFASMLACLRLGIVYTNLDPDNPWERLQKILTVCRAQFVINPFAKLSHFNNLSDICEVFDLVQLVEELPNPSVQLPALGTIPGSSPAYIMFTSGSTGVPKGAVMSHMNLLSFISWVQERFCITSEDVFTNVNPLFFDNSVFDFYTAIYSGASLVPFSQEQVKDPRLLIRLAGESACTIWFSVPSLLVYLLTTRTISADSLPNLRKIIFGGEGFPKPKLKQLFDLLAHRVEMVNVYGPTECTCICSAHSIVKGDFENMQDLATLGHLSRNFDGEILCQDDNDPNFGELVLLGPQVGLGYYNEQVRTSQSFIQNPRHARYIDIGYRTGDLHRLDSSGKLHFKGRLDFQVKHMGYRIEIEEIEAALYSIDGINECAVVYQSLGVSTGRFVGFASTNYPFSSDNLLFQVGSLIPSYMVPKWIELLDALPKNANGKIDRKCLLDML